MTEDVGRDTGVYGWQRVRSGRSMSCFHYPKIDMKLTGQRLREECQRKNFTVKDIQNYLQIGGVFSRCMPGFSGKALPSLDNMYALSYLLGRSIDELIVPQKKRILSEESSYSMEYATKDKVLLYECFPGYRARATG